MAFLEEGETLPSRLSYLFVALGNSPRHPLRRGIVLTLLLGWAVGVVLLPPLEDSLVLWLSGLAVACSLFACVGVFLDALNLRRSYPVLVLAEVTACLVLSGWCLVRQPSGAMLFRLSIPLLLSGLLLFYVIYFSVLHGKQLVSKLRFGDRFPDFTLPDSAGRPVTLVTVVAQGPALFLFYRGDW
jgi:hypothetical protein